MMMLCKKLMHWQTEKKTFFFIWKKWEKEGFPHVLSLFHPPVASSKSSKDTNKTTPSSTTAKTCYRVCVCHTDASGRDKRRQKATTPARQRGILD